MIFLVKPVILPFFHMDGKQGDTQTGKQPMVEEAYYDDRTTTFYYPVTLTHKASIPFPEVFRELLKAGEEAQHEAVAFHLEAMLRKADLGSAQKIGDTQVYSAVVDGSDPELLAHGVWHILMQKGTPVPDCGIYYAALHRASATEEERREVIDHADEYAACIVTLSRRV